MNHISFSLIIACSVLMSGPRRAAAQAARIQDVPRAAVPDNYFGVESLESGLASLSFNLIGAQDDDQEESEPATPPPRKQPDEWHFTLAPYLWMMSLRADIDIGPISVSKDACFTDLLRKLDMAAELRFEGIRNHWGFFVDGTYVGLSDDSRARIGRFRVRGIDTHMKLKEAWVDFGGFYRFGEAGRSFDLMLGGRYAYYESKVSLGPLLDIDTSDDFVSLILGGRVVYAPNEKWLVSAKGTVGGFGIGDAPDLTWGVTGLVGYRLNHISTLFVGYRYHNVEFRGGDVDLQIYGPMVGVAFDF